MDIDRWIESAKQSVLGLDDKRMEFASSRGLDSMMRDRVMSGLTRYRNDNGARLMRVVLDALVKKVAQG
jgi:hypothetical protein